MLNELAREIHKISVEKGFYDGGNRNVHEILNLIISEVIEAMDEVRAGRGTDEFFYESPYDLRSSMQSEKFPKPAGFGVELGDVIIRVLDAAAYYGIDIERAIREKLEYNKTRPHKHGKQF